MTGWDLPLFACLAAGIALVLADVPWFRQIGLTRRLQPYTPAGIGSRRRPPTSTSPARLVLEPIARAGGARLDHILGITDELTARLERAGVATTVGDFRLRQLVHSLVGLGIGGVVALITSPPPLVGLFLVIGPALCWPLIDEHFLSRRERERRQRLELELPIIAEQLGILLAGGFSLPAGLHRIGRRGSGVAADDLRAVTRRIRSGSSETEALTEWANRSGSDAVRRLVAVLALHRDASDLGALISSEARSIRGEGHRRLIESIERRAQIVWIPVTVATLVPGLLFLAVPFIAALSRVTGGV